jgi:hypothetical protein
MKAYYRTTIAIRLLFIFFTIAVFYMDWVGSRDVEIVDHTDLTWVKESGGTKGARRINVHFRSIYTTTDQHFYLRWEYREDLKQGDTLIVQRSIVGKPAAVYKLHGERTYPLEKEIYFLEVFSFLSLLSLVSIPLCTRKNHDSMEYAMLFSVLADLVVVILYFIL